MIVDLVKDLLKHSDYAFFCLGALFLSLFLTRICITYLPKLGYVDKPGGRHIHEKPMPRGGGLAIIIAFNVLFVITAVVMKVPGMLKLELIFFISSIPLIILNLIDDKKALKSGVKLYVQLAVAALVWYFIKPQCTLYGWKVPMIVTFAACEIWIILVMNAYNLTDGLDGLASGLCMLSSGGFAAYFFIRGGCDILVFAMLLLIASVLGFYRYNFHPAKIFLGDVGSTYLGFLMAIAGIQVLNGRDLTINSFFMPLLLVGMPLVDVGFAIWRRTVRKVLNPQSGGVMEADHDHLHHRLLRRFDHNHYLAVGSIYLFDLALITTAIVFQLFCSQNGALIGVVMIILFLTIIRQLGIIELTDTSKMIQKDFGNKAIFLNNILHPCVDSGAVVIAYIGAAYLAFGTYVSWILFACFVLPVTLIMAANHIYRINWLRGGIQNYAKLLISLFVGVIVSCFAGIIYFYGVQPSHIVIPTQRIFVVFICLFAFFLMALIFLERFILHYSESFWMKNLYMNDLNKQATRVLVYGGGLNCRILSTYIYSSRHKDSSERIIGVIDDDKSLLKTSAFGFPVLGVSTDVARIYRNNPFEKIIMTISGDNSESEQMLRVFCKRHHIQMELMTLVFKPCLEEEDLPADHQGTETNVPEN